MTFFFLQSIGNDSFLPNLVFYGAHQPCTKLETCALPYNRHLFVLCHHPQHSVDTENEPSAVCNGETAQVGVSARLEDVVKVVFTFLGEEVHKHVHGATAGKRGTGKGWGCVR